MNKLFFSFLFFFASLSTGFAQKTTSFFIEGGAARNSFQDLKYSNVSYGGLGAAFKIGFEKESENHIWNVRLGSSFVKETSNTFSVGSATTFYPKMQFRFLKKINDKLSVGGQWDIIGLYFRRISNLTNNGRNYLASSDLMGSVNYQRGKFNFGLNLGLLSFQKELHGFAFSAPQVLLENGGFDYQAENIVNPFGFKYYTFFPLGKQLILQTNISYQLGKRLSVAYNWSVRHFATVKNYPATIGNHQVLIRYNLIHKVKEVAVKN